MAKKATRKSNTARRNLVRLSKEEEKHLFGDKEDTIWDGPEAPDFSKKEEYEFVNHPKHYNDLPNGIECIDVIEHFPANISLAMKHLWRAGKKPGAETQQDLDKALWYVNRQKKLLAGECPKINK